MTQRIDHAADQFRADWHRQDLAGTFDRVAFGDVLVFAENNRADRITLKVQRQSVGVLRELQHLALHNVGQAMNTANAVGHGDDRALCARLAGRAEVLDSALDQFTDF